MRAPLRTHCFGLEESVASLVEDYLAGESVSLIQTLTDVCSQVEMLTCKRRLKSEPGSWM